MKKFRIKVGATTTKSERFAYYPQILKSWCFIRYWDYLLETDGRVHGLPTYKRAVKCIKEYKKSIIPFN